MIQFALVPSPKVVISWITIKLWNFYITLFFLATILLTLFCSFNLFQYFTCIRVGKLLSILFYFFLKSIKVEGNSHVSFPTLMCFQVYLDLCLHSKRTLTWIRTFRKTRTGLLEKVDPIPKLTVWVKDSFLRHLRVLISDMTIAFSNSKVKDPKVPK